MVLTLVIGCEDPTPAVHAPAPVRIGVLPDQSAQNLRQLYAPLLEYLRDTTKLEYTLLIPDDYAQLLAAFANREIDVAWFGGLTFAQAHACCAAQPLAMRDVDLRFTSYYLVRTGHPGQTVADLAGQRFAFGSRLSTSGHLMPRYFLTKAGIDVEHFFGTVVYSGAHDATAAMVRDGKADIGVVNAEIVETMFEDGRLSRDDVRVIETTPIYADYVWAVQADLDPATRNALLSALLALDIDKPDHARVLKTQRAGGYLPAALDDFTSVRDAARQFDLLDAPRTP